MSFKAEQFEKLVRTTNTKCIQTTFEEEELAVETRHELSVQAAPPIQGQQKAQEVGTDLASWDVEQGRVDGATQYDPMVEEEKLQQAAAIVQEVEDTVSQATTVPMDSSW